jgi:hypothetical protein
MLPFISGFVRKRNCSVAVSVKKLQGPGNNTTLIDEKPVEVLIGDLLELRIGVIAIKETNRFPIVC